MSSKIPCKAYIVFIFSGHFIIVSLFWCNNIKEALHFYVKSIDAKKNIVSVCAKDGVYESLLSVGSLNMFDTAKTFECEVKVRYRSEKRPARVCIEDGVAKVELREPQFAIAKGQAAVFYNSEKVLGGGYIL